MREHEAVVQQRIAQVEEGHKEQADMMSAELSVKQQEIEEL
jgi:hypothetical protein